MPATRFEIENPFGSSIGEAQLHEGIDRMISRVPRRTIRVPAIGPASAEGILILPALVNWAGESDAMIRKKLEVIVKDDLLCVVAEMPDSSIADSTWYDIVSSQTGKKGDYSAKAEVDFDFLKGVRVKMFRRYRYVSRIGKWERYTNEWRFEHGRDTLH